LSFTFFFFFPKRSVGIIRERLKAVPFCSSFPFNSLLLGPKRRFPPLCLFSPSCPRFLNCQHSFIMNKSARVAILCSSRVRGSMFDTDPFPPPFGRTRLTSNSPFFNRSFFTTGEFFPTSPTLSDASKTLRCDHLICLLLPPPPGVEQSGDDISHFARFFCPIRTVQWLSSNDFLQFLSSIIAAGRMAVSSLFSSVRRWKRGCIITCGTTTSTLENRLCFSAEHRRVVRWT